jgi:hypothetical protein
MVAKRSISVGLEGHLQRFFTALSMTANRATTTDKGRLTTELRTTDHGQPTLHFQEIRE